MSTEDPAAQVDPVDRLIKVGRWFCLPRVRHLNQLSAPLRPDTQSAPGSSSAEVPPDAPLTHFAPKNMIRYF